MENNIKVCYGYVDENAQSKRPKNTLITKQEGDTIYFGISRCDIRLDQVDKREGKRRAMRRLRRAIKTTNGNNQYEWLLWHTEGTFKVHNSGLFGRVDVKDTAKLLEYFNNVDDIMFQKSRADV